MITTAEMIIRLFLGALLGGIIGFERQTHGRPAGFRTHLLVSLASVLFMIVSEYSHYLSTIDPAYMRIDPARIAQGAITGVGFIGAGVILKTGLTIQGLTTAASIWVVSAVGIAVGSGLYVAGILTTGITYLSLWFLRIVERNISKLTYKSLVITSDGCIEEDAVVSVLRDYGTISNTEYSKDFEKGECTYYLTVAIKSNLAVRQVIDGLSSLKGIKKVTLRG